MEKEVYVLAIVAQRAVYNRPIDLETSGRKKKLPNLFAIMTTTKAGMRQFILADPDLFYPTPTPTLTRSSYRYGYISPS